MWDSCPCTWNVFSLGHYFYLRGGQLLLLRFSWLFIPKERFRASSCFRSVAAEHFVQALDKQYSRTLLVLPSVVNCDAFLLFSPAIKQASLGGCVRMIVTGAAPASPTVLGFLRAALGCQVGSRGSSLTVS